MRIRLKDYDGALKRLLRAHQETRQQNQRFFMAVPQNPWVSPNVEYPNIFVQTVEDAESGSTTLKLKAKEPGQRFNLYPRWFFRMFLPVDHYKVYNFAIDEHLVVGNPPAEQKTIQIYPALVQDVPANTTLAMWPFMNVLWSRLILPGELPMERRNVHIVTVEVTENY